MPLKQTAAFALGVMLTSCGSASAPSSSIGVVATTSTLAALARGVAGTRATVSTLVPVGVSPEDFQPTPRDAERLHAAGVLVENGAGLESWLDNTVAGARNPQLVTVVCTRGLPVSGGNPHLWMDPVFARAYVEKIRAALVRRDPGGAAIYDGNARDYTRSLAALDRRIARSIATIPRSRRRMIVFHDAWKYYDARYGLQTAGVIETSPGREPNPADLARLVAIARRDRIPAIFTEPEYSPKLVQAIARSAGIRTIAALYDDSVGDDPRVSEYISMLEYDTATIVRALKS